MIVIEDQILLALGISPMHSGEINIRLTYRALCRKLVAMKQRSDSNTPEVWGEILEWELEAIRYGVAVCLFTKDKISSNHILYGLVSKIDPINESEILG